MRTPIVIVLLSYLCFLSPGRSQPATDQPATDQPAADQDASDTFLKAYMAFQRGEKLEKQGEVDSARAKYEEAIAILRGLRSEFPQWNPQIVRHRWRKAVDAVKRLSEPARGAVKGSATHFSYRVLPWPNEPCMSDSRVWRDRCWGEGGL